mmetsp:Transcript_32764/g.52443  ORF Transcript_32764/g.52443 Transcript_32764/m.52443 type:complete len:291 (-) Transcript_32764:199-1071(-)
MSHIIIIIICYYIILIILALKTWIYHLIYKNDRKKRERWSEPNVPALMSIVTTIMNDRQSFLQELNPFLHAHICLFLIARHKVFVHQSVPQTEPNMRAQHKPIDILDADRIIVDMQLQLPIGDKPLWHLTPMQSGILVMNDMISIIERQLVIRRGQQIHGEPMIIFVVLWVDKDMLAEVAPHQSHRQYQLWDEEEPQADGGSNVVVNVPVAAKPEHHDKHRLRQHEPVSLEAEIVRQLDPDCKLEAQPIMEIAEREIVALIRHRRREVVGIDVVLAMVHDHVVEAVDSRR